MGLSRPNRIEFDIGNTFNIGRIRLRNGRLQLYRQASLGPARLLEFDKAD